MKKEQAVLKALFEIADKHWPAYHQELAFEKQAMELRLHPSVKPEDVVKIETAAGKIILSPELQQTSFWTQDPYKEKDKKMMETSMRKNWAVNTSIGTREHFVFSKGSQLMIELAPEEQEGKTKQQQAEFIKSKPEWQSALKQLDQRDKNLQIIGVLRTFYWQLFYGRAVIIKKFKGEGDDAKVIALKPINSRRLGNVLINPETDSMEGVLVDGIPVRMAGMIYSPYADLQLSPHTEYYGYSPMEPILHIAEALNIAMEEDVKEILKSAWVATILLQINTKGLSPTAAKDKLKDLLDKIRPGKIMGTTADTTPHLLNMQPNFSGLRDLFDNMEQKIYKQFSVPQFLVQNEGIANRSIGDKSAQLFIDGVVSADQELIQAILTNQWYEPELRKLLKITEVEKELPIRIKRVFNKPKVSDFVDLTDAIVKLKHENIIDLQKALEELGMPDVWERVQALQETNPDDEPRDLEDEDEEEEDEDEQ